jgi:hypothetical protein
VFSPNEAECSLFDYDVEIRKIVKDREKQAFSFLLILNVNTHENEHNTDERTSSLTFEEHGFYAFVGLSTHAV